MTYQGGPGDYPQRQPGEGPAQPGRRGEDLRRVEPASGGGWRAEPPWAPTGPEDKSAPPTMILRLDALQGDRQPGGGGSGDGNTGHVYFTVKFEPRPPAYTAKIVAIYGLTFVLHLAMTLVCGFTPELAKSQLWIVATVMLTAATLPAISGVLVDHPESVWAKRWTAIVFALALTAWLGIIGYSYQQFT